MATAVDYEIRRFNKNATMHFTIRTSREFKVRTWIALRFLWLAGWALGGKVEVNIRGPR